MLRILNKEIDVDKSSILYNTPFNPDTLEKYWQIYNGDWKLEDGWLTGENYSDYPEFIMSKEKYPGNIMLDFEARTVTPCNNDINFLWNSSMYEDKKDLAESYIGSIGGWWEGKVGLEKSPTYDIFSATSIFKVEPGITYHIQAGSIDGHLFLFIDGKLAIETIDSHPIDSTIHSRVGFDVYASHVQIQKVVIRQISWKPISLSYNKSGSKVGSIAD